MQLTDKEVDAYNRTGMFVTLFDWTWDGNQVRRALAVAVALVLISILVR